MGQSVGCSGVENGELEPRLMYRFNYAVFHIYIQLFYDSQTRHLSSSGHKDGGFPVANIPYRALRCGQGTGVVLGIIPLQPIGLNWEAGL